MLLTTDARGLASVKHPAEAQYLGRPRPSLTDMDCGARPNRLMAEQLDAAAQSAIVLVVYDGLAAISLCVDQGMDHYLTAADAVVLRKP